MTFTGIALLDMDGYLRVVSGSEGEMPATHAIQIRFLRRTPNGAIEQNSLRDDLLLIHKLGENSLRVTYTERTADGALSDTTLMTYQKMLHYVSRILWLLGLDSDPFHSVQVMIPAYPTVLVPIARIQEQAVMIMDLLVNTCWHWPTAARVDAPAAQGRSRIAGDSTVGAFLRAAVVAPSPLRAAAADTDSGSDAGSGQLEAEAPART
jgi:hypothetical protein